MPTVKKVIAALREAGLDVRRNPSPRSHTKYDIVDPGTGTILTGISGNAGKPGNDPNWHHNLRRILKRCGYDVEFENKQHRNRSTGEDMARSDSASAPEFEATMRRLRLTLEVHNDELIEAAKARLVSEGKRPTGGAGKGARAQFVRIAMEVAAERNLRTWASLDSGQTALWNLLEKNQKGASQWAVDLLNATMDHIDGIKFEVLDQPAELDTSDAQAEKFEAAVQEGAEQLQDATPPQGGDENPETRYPEQESEVLLSMVSELESKLSDIHSQLLNHNNRLVLVEDRKVPVTNGDIREQYAAALLTFITNPTNDSLFEAALDRLDKLAGI